MLRCVHVFTLPLRRKLLHVERRCNMYKRISMSRYMNMIVWWLSLNYGNDKCQCCVCMCAGRWIDSGSEARRVRESEGSGEMHAWCAGLSEEIFEHASYLSYMHCAHVNTASNLLICVAGTAGSDMFRRNRGEGVPAASV